jgi:hypothetical protein
LIRVGSGFGIGKKYYGLALMAVSMSGVSGASGLSAKYSYTGGGTKYIMAIDFETCIHVEVQEIPYVSSPFPARSWSDRDRRNSMHLLYRYDSRVYRLHNNAGV